MKRTDESGRAYLPDPECGVPGGGRGRRDEVGGSGVYPASAGNAPPGAVPRMQAGWGEGDRGRAGYEDSGGSGGVFYPAELDAAAPADDAPPPRRPGVEPW